MAQQHKVLVIGSGGREHALAWKLAASEQVSEVWVAPGNAGTAREAGCRNLDIAVADIDGLLAFALEHQVSLTVVGPELPLALGIVDAFRDAGLLIFGPTRAAAQLESSKAFCKDFLARHRIPTADYAVFTDANAACAYIEQHGAPIVVKADGLAAGKGVVVAATTAEACAAVQSMLADGSLGAAGARVVIESHLSGEEASFIVIAHGSDYLVLPTSQDHKRIGEGDTGPNTGGMGAYSPAPVVTQQVHDDVCRNIVEPTLRGMLADGVPFTGFLYVGLMIDAQAGARVLEFNTRLGDPETQPLMLRIRSDLFALLFSAAQGQFGGQRLEIDPWPSIGVVLAAEGYPQQVRSGDVIGGLEHDPAPARVFHAGTADYAGAVVTAGGRVLCVCASAPSLAQARAQAYAAVDRLHWRGVQFRRDIGHRALRPD